MEPWNGWKIVVGGPTATEIPCWPTQTKPTEHRMNVFGVHTECEGPESTSAPFMANGGREAMNSYEPRISARTEGMVDYK
jgi:hypothetical protein